MVVIFCLVLILRNFSGRAGDDDFKNEKFKLRESLRDAKDDKIQLNENMLICIAYDPPYKMFNRRNEVILVSKD
jgi:hypothetical protein